MRGKHYEKKFFTFLFSFLVVGCAEMKQKKVSSELENPQAINCATAEGDVRLLNQAKASVAERVVEGVTAVAPTGLVIGVVTGTETTKAKVAVGTYNDMIDKRIAEIKQTCGL